MMNKKIVAFILAGIMAFTYGSSPVLADTEDEIAAAQVQKQEAEAELSQAQAEIDSLESKRAELENYLAQLDAQYNQLTEGLSELSVQAGEKEEELKQIEAELEEAKAAAEEQYEAMKIRIAYMYENSGMTMLQVLLSSESLADFLNNANNVAEISRYDRDMLTKYEETRAVIAENESRVEEEAAEIDRLLSEQESKRQEIQTMTETTSASILSYVNEISASQEEAGVLLAEINNADNNISELMQQAAVEAQEMQAAEASDGDSGDSGTAETAAVSSDAMSQFDPETDTLESSSSSSSSAVVEEYYEESYYEEEEYEEETESSGQGTYLGNFMLTGYCNCAQCCGTAGNATASGVMPSSGHTVAMAGVPFGTQLLINGTVYTVEDLGTPYGHVDIYFDSHETALNFGTQYADVYQL